jgi:hypothetical protein
MGYATVLGGPVDARSPRETWLRSRKARENLAGSREAQEDASIEGGLVGMRTSKENYGGTRGVSEDR